MRTPPQGVKHTLETTTRDRAAVRSRVSNQSSGLFLSASGCGSQHPRVPWAALASCWPLPQQLLPASATDRGRRCCRFQRLGMSTVVAAAAMRKGVFNLTRTGIAAELTAASGGNREPQPETARRCAFILNTTCQFMDKKPGRGTRSGALLPGFSAFFSQISGLKW